MAHEPVYESFRGTAPDGRTKTVQFKKAGFLSTGDQPEVYFFDVDGNQVVVVVSGAALRELQRPPQRAFSREEKIDLAGLRLKQEIEASSELGHAAVYINGPELESLGRTLGFIR